MNVAAVRGAPSGRDLEERLSRHRLLEVLRAIHACIVVQVLGAKPRW
jgi:hypothetical protein